MKQMHQQSDICGCGPWGILSEALVDQLHHVGVIVSRGRGSLMLDCERLLKVLVKMFPGSLSEIN